MQVQQQNVDNIANNLANASTVGFKRTRLEFQDLLYQNMRTAGGASTASTNLPVGLQIGLGARSIASEKIFTQGDFKQTENPLDMVIEGSGFVMQGHEQICGIPAMLKGMYSRTLHQVHNQTVTVSGDTAEAETYCSANHLTELGGGSASNLVWAMRYQDRLQRHNGQWRFQRRTVVIDWTETRPAQFTPPPAPG